MDVATGTGIVAIAAAEIVGSEGKVIGVDFTPGMLELNAGRSRSSCTAKSGLFDKIHSLFNFLSASFNQLELSRYFTSSLMILWS